MKQQGLVLIFICSCACLFSQSYDSIYNLDPIKSSKEIKGLIKKNLLAWINDPVIVSAVKEANAKNAKRSGDAIDELDKKWAASGEIEEWMKPFFESPAAQLLVRKQKESNGLFVEIFVVDFQGCNVAQSGKTSDFLQGDEDKFKNSFGKKSVYIDKVKYDESTKTSSMQVSLPVYDAASKSVIGAITITIDMARKDLLKKWG